MSVSLKRWGCANVYDSSTMARDQWKDFQGQLKKLRVEIIDLNDPKHKDFPLLSHIKLELQYNNWARASDLTRVSALFLSGGVYADTDLIPHASLASLRGSLGILGAIYKDIESMADLSTKVGVNIDFLAATKRHPVFAACIDLFNKIYAFSSAAKYKLLLNTEDGNVNEEMTRYLSGLTFSKVLRVCFSEDEITQQVRIRPSNFVTIQRDGSWQKDHLIVNSPARAKLKEYDAQYAATIDKVAVPKCGKKAKDLYMDRDKWHAAVAQFAFVTTRENVVMLTDNQAKWDCPNGVKTHGLFSNYLNALKLQRVNRAWQARIAGDQKKLGMQNP